VLNSYTSYDLPPNQYHFTIGSMSDNLVIVVPLIYWKGVRGFNFSIVVYLNGYVGGICNP